MFFQCLFMADHWLNFDPTGNSLVTEIRIITDCKQIAPHLSILLKSLTLLSSACSEYYKMRMIDTVGHILAEISIFI